MSESGEVRFGDSVIQYTVVRSRRRRKTIQITLDPEQGVVVAAPVRVPQREIKELVTQRAGWILRRLAERSPNGHRRQFVSGESLLFLGVESRLIVEQSTAKRVTIAFEPWECRVIVPTHIDGYERREAIEKALTRWCQAQAGEMFAKRLEYWASIAGYAPKSVHIRSQRQRWGSCSADGTIRLNWRVVMAATEIIDYVLVHELVHVRVKNHSSDFWAEVARLMPDYKQRRKRLREIGPSLTF